MNAEEIVAKYINAWNRKDVAGLLDLMHPGAAYYDAFWMEACVGRDLARYLQDSMTDEPYWYEQIEDTIRTEHGIAYRYSAHDCAAPPGAAPIYCGAEILSIRDGKILTVTDTYCSPERSSLIQLSDIVARRHGLTSHVNAGLGALKTARIKASLCDSIEKEKVYLDPDLTMSRLAEIVGCTPDQLYAVIENHFEGRQGDFVDIQRVEYAKELLAVDPDDPEIVYKVATSAGFRSISEFRKKFAEIVGVTPTVFRIQQK